MPKVFLVKRKSPGVSVRSWDELPDEKRADTYIPGERRAGAGPGSGAPGVGEGVVGSFLLLGQGGVPRFISLFRSGTLGSFRGRKARNEVEKPGSPSPPQREPLIARRRDRWLLRGPR
jgi:hypothetical protein